jgi:UDP:flavonoid glycosyltransferase YjiC (YdhE family)
VARILFVWELGAGLGHVARLVLVARRLRAGGHACLFALRRPDQGRGLAAEGFAAVQAPVAAPQVQTRIGSFGDMLGAVGWADEARLSALLAAWQGLFDRARPDLVVADYAPTACLAALGQIPCVSIGDGFVLPPPDLPHFPPLGSAPLRFSESDILSTVHKVQRSRGRILPETLPAILAGAGSFVVTLPEMDFYRRHRRQPAVGMLSPMPAPTRESPEEDYFAYLSLAWPHTPKVLLGLAQSGRTGSVFLRDAPESAVAEWRARGLTVHDRPQAMPAAADRAAVVLHHGGIGTAEAALCLGRPQLLVPCHVEHAGNGKALRVLGVASLLPARGFFQAGDVGSALTRLLGTSAIRDTAARVAADLAARGSPPALDMIVSCCAAWLGRTGPSDPHPAQAD